MYQVMIGGYTFIQQRIIFGWVIFTRFQHDSCVHSSESFLAFPEMYFQPGFITMCEQTLTLILLPEWPILAPCVVMCGHSSS